ncbi:hypothetical protein BX616_000979 [Lobosporangium transversale]|uniref:Uncharacterized protein n=1 Tax=Lobosporangium transversale TaxID=64571 RepID=A0A1Y2GYW9_9FUNG|nr:hypothetical protein BCR41DRAFT_393282 [Lobosporangium transversale]KAF9917443.1 hypothetical protein BX616_000979 [Lobosporangium transversale]ORZ26673.1 hypothetical protein BCR41DRAFT_393282 [Lobosporangium transversale]|eukprot:XP_021884436.1 hypothetical protein BCR41DRAFT_393282 [Lobosporangium transversale]
MSRNPFDVPDIRARLIQALDTNSVVACSRVSKTWNDYFTQRAWKSIDLKAKSDLKELDPRIVTKNGHLIRHIKGIKKRSELGIFFAASSVKYLESLCLGVKSKHGFRPQTIKLIQRNLATLNRLEVWGRSTESDRVEFGWLVEALMPLPPFNNDNTCSGSRLTHLSLGYIQMTRHAFSKILSYCPRLKDMTISHCGFLGSSNASTTSATASESTTANDEEVYFGHKGVTSIYASLSQVFHPTRCGSAIPLLVHFPALEKWEVWSYMTPLDPAASVIQSALREYCPHLKGAAVNHTAGPVAHEFLRKVFVHLSYIAFPYKKLRPEVILGILVHQSTVQTIRAYDSNFRSFSYYVDEVLPVAAQDPFTESWMIQLMMSRCPKLLCVDFPTHEMNMDMVEQFPWICKDLTYLGVRIRGLDTKDLIMTVIKKWARGCHARRRRKKAEVAAAVSCLQTKEKIKKRRKKKNGEEDEKATSERQDEEEDGGSGEDESTKRKSMKDEGEEVKPKKMDMLGHPEGQLPLMNAALLEEQDLLLASDVSTSQVLDTEKTALVNRVARHLLQFPRLKVIWLGYKLWTVPT